VASSNIDLLIDFADEHQLQQLWADLKWAWGQSLPLATNNPEKFRGK
jgi:hypothetical protein